MDEEVKYGRRATDVEHIGTVTVPVRKQWWAYLYHEAFEAGIAFAAVVGAIAFFSGATSAGRDAAVSRVLGRWDDIWYALYGVGGAFILAGLLFSGASRSGDGRLELGGLCFMASALLVNALSIAHVGALNSPSAAIFAVLFLCCCARAVSVFVERKTNRAVLVPEVQR